MKQNTKEIPIAKVKQMPAPSAPLPFKPDAPVFPSQSSVDLVLKSSNGETFTTSLLIAERFGKRHDAVLRKIESLTVDVFTRLKIVVSEYTDDSGKKNKSFLLNRTAFSFIAMGFTGRKADIWKLDFIDAFDKMEAHLQNRFKQDWAENRVEAALGYTLMSRTLEEARKLEGKDTKFFHYANEAKLVNWAMTGEYKKLDRDTLPSEMLGVLVTLEAYNAVLLGVGHDRDTRKELLKSRYDQAVLSISPSVLALA